MKRKWFLVERMAGGVDYTLLHHMADPQDPSTACGREVPPRRGVYTQHYPKKQPPKCGACRRAVARAT